MKTMRSGSSISSQPGRLRSRAVDISGDDDVADVVVPRVREVRGQVLQRAGAGVRRLLHAEPHERQHRQPPCISRRRTRQFVP